MVLFALTAGSMKKGEDTTLASTEVKAEPTNDIKTPESETDQTSTDRSAKPD